MADPFEALAGVGEPVAPDPAFAAALRRRLVRALRPDPPDLEPRRDHVTTEAIPLARATATPYLCVHDAVAAIDFYVAAFGAVETIRIPQPAPDTRVGHAEVDVGGARIMLSDEFPELGVLSPRTLGGSPFQLHVTFDDVDIDALFAQAVAAGATVLRPPADQFYGERAGQLVDPFGHRWTLATPTEQLTGEELLRRAAGSSAADELVDLGERAEAAPATAAGASAGDELVALAERGAAGFEAGEGDLGYVTLDVPDLQRAKAFFGTLLGWAFEPDTSFEGRSSAHVGNVTPPMGVVGGAAEAGPTLYFRVRDIREAVARTRAVGGTAGEPTLHPSGWNASCVDDQGLAFELWQPAEGY